jgi:hypothetical protein
MNRAQIEAQLAEARETCARVGRIIPRDETDQQSPPSVNQLDQWRADVRKQEAEFAMARAQRQRAEDDERNNTSEWEKWVDARVEIAVLHATKVLAEAMRDEIDQRDKNLSAMSAHIHRLEATIAKLEVRVIKGEIHNDDRSRVIDVPNMGLRKGLN